MTGSWSESDSQLSSNLPADDGPVTDQDFRCHVMYTNSLPDVPFETKFIPYPFDLKRYVPYKPTKLEANFKFDQLVEKDLEVCVDLVTWTEFEPNTSASLHPLDQRLVEEEEHASVEEKRSKHHGLAVPWMRRTEYISSDLAGYGRLSTKARIKLDITTPVCSEEYTVYRTRENQLQAINETFEQVESARLEKPGVSIVEEMAILPDFEMWKLACAQVIFDVDPTPKDMEPPAGVEVEKLALIRGMTDEQGEQFVAYLLPTSETCDKIAQNGAVISVGELLEYRLFRQYNWILKSKASAGYEENYFFHVRNGQVLYNELETRVHLSRRKLHKTNGAIFDSRILVRQRPLNEQELQAQATRMLALQPAVVRESDESYEEESIKVNEETDTWTDPKYDGLPESLTNKSESEEEQGDEEYRQGDLEYRQGDLEYRQGDEEYRQGDEEYRQGDLEYRQGDEEYRQGDLEYRQGDLEYRQGDEEYRQGDLEYRQGDEEVEVDDLSYE
uniref:RNA polymerase II-associated factor 1 homolog n=1 Tax=Trichuris muris TaxID=70415 RepID=A0A5S6Q9D3_TRIMR